MIFSCCGGGAVGADAAQEIQVAEVTPNTGPSTASDVVVCELCGTRLHRNDQPDVLEVGADHLRTVARHRCAPRVAAPRRPALVDVKHKTATTGNS